MNGKGRNFFPGRTVGTNGQGKNTKKKKKKRKKKKGGRSEKVNTIASAPTILGIIKSCCLYLLYL